MGRKATPHVTAAKRYAREVLNGKQPAGRFVRLACQRFTNDLKRVKAKSYPYRFDTGEAERVCVFAEALPHVKGHWAVGGHDETRIVLQDWQCFGLCNLFGWLRKVDGLRRYRHAYWEIPRKNGKSVTAAIVGDFMFAADGEFGAEVYSGATGERQAWEVFRPARLMAKRTSEFLEAYGVEIGAKNMHIAENGSRFEAIVGKPGDGASPHCAIVDEYHEHPTDELYDTMLTGMGARRQPLLFAITTAGSDIAGPCYALRADAIKVVEGNVENDRMFVLIYTIDDDDDWTDPKILRKANPNFDVSVSGEYLEAQQQDAITSPRKQNTFKTKHLNVWVHARSPWVNMHAWAQAADPTLCLDDFEGEQAYAGADVAAKRDLTTWVRVFPRTIDGEQHFYVFGEHWLPEETADDPNLPHYAEWVNTGDLMVTAGQLLDLDAIEAAMQSAAEHHELTDIGFDPWGAYQLMGNLQEGKNGRPLVVTEVPQTVKYLSDPMKWIAAYIEAGRIHHCGDPVLTWCVSNVTVREDANENIFPRKERVEQKIDAAVAMIIAFNRLLLADEPTESVYATRGLLILGGDDEGATE